MVRRHRGGCALHDRHGHTVSGRHGVPAESSDPWANLTVDDVRVNRRDEEMPCRAYDQLAKNPNMPRAEYSRIAKRAPRRVQVAAQLALAVIICGGFMALALAIIIAANAILH
jgi:sirohydrochlorin ferrochelatase